MLQRPSLHWVRKPPPLRPIMPTPVPLPSGRASPAAAIARIRRHASKDRFFSFPFFVSFLTNVTETLFTPYARSENSCPPPHNNHPHALPLKPCKSHCCHCLHLWVHK